MRTNKAISAKNKENLVCPSYVCKPGAKLYGIINSKGIIDYLKEPIIIDDTFMVEAHKGREPEKRFRFAGNCVKSGCKQWDTSGHECGLINDVIDIIGNDTTELQHCSIRKKCRWYSQRGGHACAQCNEVIRNMEASLVC
jgi:hypothetical protein